MSRNFIFYSASLLNRVIFIDLRLCPVLRLLPVQAVLVLWFVKGHLSALGQIDNRTLFVSCALVQSSLPEGEMHHHVVRATWRVEVQA